MPVCPRCGTFSDKKTAFCTECGLKLDFSVEEKTENAELHEGGEPAWKEQYRQYVEHGAPQYRQQRETDGQDPSREKVPDPDRSVKSNRSIGIISLIFGILGMCCCFFPLFSAAGLVTGIKNLSGGNGTGPGKAGLILSITGLVFFAAALVICAINGFSFTLSGFRNYVGQFI